MKNTNFKSGRAQRRRAKSHPMIFQSLSKAESLQARAIAYKAALAIIG
jgi:hypothetical protein